MRTPDTSALLFVTIALLSFVPAVRAQTSPKETPASQTGYAVKKPVLGAACPTCPWGAMADVVKAALEPYGWDPQICYYCAGGPRAARMVAGAMVAAPPKTVTAPTLPTPNGRVEFGATGAEFLQWAYRGIHDFAKDPEGARTNLRLVANIQMPTFFVVAVKADSGIADLRDIVSKRLPVRVLAPAGFGEQLLATVLDYYGLTGDAVKSFGGDLTATYTRGAPVDVMIGFAALVNAPEYAYWYDLTQRYDLKYLELPPDLRAKLVKDFYLQHRHVPLGLLRGVERRIPTVARTGTAVYGRTDMPDDFAYTLAKALDEQQDLFQWSHMRFSYNWRTVGTAFDVPLHPGAARYYREKGYIKSAAASEGRR